MSETLGISPFSPVSTVAGTYLKGLGSGAAAANAPPDEGSIRSNDLDELLQDPNSSNTNRNGRRQQQRGAAVSDRFRLHVRSADKSTAAPNPRRFFNCLVKVSDIAECYYISLELLEAAIREWQPSVLCDEWKVCDVQTTELCVRTRLRRKPTTAVTWRDRPP